MIIDCAHYRDGARQHEGPISPEEAAKLCKGGSEFVWLGLYEPSEEELEGVAKAFGLNELAVEDASRGHQRPKLEDYEGELLRRAKTARYDDDKEEVEFGEIHLFIGTGYVIAVRHGEASVPRPRPRAARGAPRPARDGGRRGRLGDSRQGRGRLRPGRRRARERPRGGRGRHLRQHGDSTQRIYFLKREVIEFHRAVAPAARAARVARARRVPQIDAKLQSFFRDVADHARRVDENVLSQRELLTSILEANLALLSVRQNEVVRQISGWAAIIAVPTFIASVYGMNFEYMPELDTKIGYPLALLVMFACVVVLYRFFKRIDWL